MGLAKTTEKAIKFAYEYCDYIENKYGKEDADNIRKSWKGAEENVRKAKG